MTSYGLFTTATTADKNSSAALKVFINSF